MISPSAKLAREITRRGSKQTYLTIRLLADKRLLDDCYRAYAYFRWADDVVDEQLNSNAERTAFVHRQIELVEGLYRRQRPPLLRTEETMIADLISHDRVPNSRLRSYIVNFLAVIKFDAERNGREVTREELQTYSDRLAVAVTDAIQYFIQNDHDYPDHEHRTAAARAAHLTHMLRDFRADLQSGYLNIPSEYLGLHGIRPNAVASPAFRDWVRGQVAQAREGFRLGKSYIDSLDAIRTKLAAHWYCCRFEPVLDRIEADGYRLRLNYRGSSGARPWIRIGAVTLRVVLQHLRAVSNKGTHPYARGGRANGRSPLSKPELEGSPPLGSSA